jgi:hypothetical protein
MNFSTACVFIGALNCLTDAQTSQPIKYTQYLCTFFREIFVYYFGDYASSERIWSEESNGDWPHPFVYQAVGPIFIDI